MEVGHELERGYAPRTNLELGSGPPSQSGERGGERGKGVKSSGSIRFVEKEKAAFGGSRHST